ncbi:type III secretion system effector protein [Xanthomonas campestris pv. campestris]|uniref:Type III secretion system effector protein n=1 Tax=Xanthomonas campestris pv. campestris (strain B100) TaxID=509169 RepID=B0RMF9_XANCB|nr:type III secretion system effector protein [Xanthomonas campestris pv. campestris]CEM60273.1 type III secretion system effector protein [Xanthomonas campestris pv. campestris]
MPRITSFFTRQTPVDNPQRAQSPVGAVRNERTPPADQTQRAPGPLSGLSRRQPNAGARSETSRPRLAADVLEFDELGAALESSEIPQLDPSERRRFNVDTTASAQLVSAGGRVLQRSTQLRSYESVLLEWRDQCAANADQWREAWISANESVTGAELNLEVALRISAAHLARAASHNVASLDLSYLPLPRFPEQTYRFGHLQDMSIAGAGLLELPESISDLANLRTLTLSQNPIGALPASISRLGELQELTIFSCPNLTELPEHLAIRNTAGQREGLVKLRTLTLSRTGIRSLPSSLEYLKDLTHLKINSSPLTELNTSIHRLPLLEEVDLRGCTRLRHYPSISGQQWSLRKLSLQDCSSLQTLPSNIDALRNLQELDLRGCNNLRALPPSISGLPDHCTIRAPAHLQASLDQLRPRRPPLARPWDVAGPSTPQVAGASSSAARPSDDDPAITQARQKIEDTVYALFAAIDEDRNPFVQNAPYFIPEKREEGTPIVLGEVDGIQQMLKESSREVFKNKLIGLANSLQQRRIPHPWKASDRLDTAEHKAFVNSHLGTFNEHSPINGVSLYKAAQMWKTRELLVHNDPTNRDFLPPIPTYSLPEQATDASES